ncbi:MAG: response regulator transcription factor [Oscillospiraceae bacterium]
MNILIVEDETALAEAVAHILRKAGHSADRVADGQSALDYIRVGAYDLVLLDIMLPKLDGLSLLRQMRSEGVQTPVLMLTARTTVPDKVAGLNAGADDYLTKPFDPEELLARVGAMTRRKGAMVLNEISFQDLTLDLNTVTLRCGARDVQLSPKEFALARLMLSEPSMTYSKDLLISRAWGLDSEATDNNVEAYISFLRKKLRYLGSKVASGTYRKSATDWRSRHESLSETLCAVQHAAHWHRSERYGGGGRYLHGERLLQQSAHDHGAGGGAPARLLPAAEG